MTRDAGLTVSAHQSDLLPYSGFFYKLANSDIMDLRIHAQFVERGYQRRVKMRDKWAHLVLAGKPKLEPITDVRIDNAASRETLIRYVSGRYNNAPYWKQRGPEICDAINSVDGTDMLWQFNLELIFYIRDLLGIKTPIAISGASVGAKGEGVLSYLQRYPGITTYLSGTGAKKYMSDTTMFEERGITVEWSRHKPVTGDSMVSVILDYADPLEIVLQRKAEGEE